jgi:hypothetical protein
MLIPMGLQAFASMFLIQTFGVVGFMAFARAVVRRKKRRAVQQVDEDDFTERAPPVRLPPQFSLGHLFTWPLVGATILALALNVPDEEELTDLATIAAWISLGLLGLMLAVATLLAWTLVAMGRWRTVAVAVAALFLGALVGQQSGIAARLAARFEIWDGWVLVAVSIVSLSTGLSCCLWLLALAGWNWWPRTTAASPWSSKGAVAVIVLVSVTFTLPTLDLGLSLVPPARPSEAEPPQPNGYEKLAHIEEQMNWGPVSDIDANDATASQSEQFVRDNEDRLTALVDALDLPSRVTVYWQDTWPDQGRIFRNLYHALDVAARSAIAHGDNSRAAEYYLSALRMGNICANGGTGLDELIANSIEGQAANHLAVHLSRLTDEQLSHVQQITQQCLRGREPIEPLVDRSERHELITGGWPGRLSAWLVKRRLSEGWDGSTELTIHRARRTARLRLLIVKCALQRYHLINGRYPEKLSQLKPKFLDAVPRDPFADDPFKYRCTTAGYLLYSLNGDRVDDGGFHKENDQLYEGDLMLENPE